MYIQYVIFHLYILEGIIKSIDIVINFHSENCIGNGLKMARRDFEGLLDGANSYDS